MALLGVCTRGWGAQQDDTFSVAAGIARQHESNFFRLADGEQPVIDGAVASRDESLNTATLGASFDKTWSRQRFRAAGEFRALRFGEFDYLDYNATSYNIQWDWQVGRRWSGVLGHLTAEQGRSYADFVLTTQSINTYRNFFARADLTLPSRWKIGVGAASVSSRFSDELSAPEEYDEDSGDVHVTLRSSSDNEVSVAVRRADAKYVNRPLSLTSDIAYQQTDVRVIANLRLSPKSEFSGYVGMASRRFPVLTSRNYSGPIGRIDYMWTPSPKLQLSTTLRRELGAHEDITDTFVVTSAADFKLEWQLRLKVRAVAQASVQQRDAGGDPGLGFTAVSGETDRVWSQGVTLAYDPIRHVEVLLSAEREVRESGSAFQHFQNFTYRAGVRVFR